MKDQIHNFPEHTCQLCGSERKWVVTLIDDEFIWNEDTREYEPHKFTDDFEHTGNEWCAECREEWTGF